MEPLRFATSIGRLWDGTPTLPAEHTYLSAKLEGDSLGIEVDAPFYDDPVPSSPPGRCPGLWNHEVVELFLVGPEQRYIEIELGPHGHYLVLGLQGRRNVVRDDWTLDYAVRFSGSRWLGEAFLPLDAAPLPLRRWNAFAIHGAGDGRRYFAAHALGGDEPDFHRIEEYPAFEI